MDWFEALTAEPPTKRQLDLIKTLCTACELDPDDYVPESKRMASNMIEELIEVRKEVRNHEMESVIGQDWYI